ncbi:FAD-binding protein [Cellulomonas sp. NPDC089187]|uniref:FAD-binding protein n=1 Tax=Cellulomonas sp. NPDC089187 TaxID=3154970 RepID=UPI00343A83E7
MTLTTWAGNLTYHHQQLHRPTSMSELQDLVARSRHIRALGTRHSFNDLADTTGDLVQLHGFPSQVDIDPQARTVTVSAGARYGTVVQELDRQGWALHNLASLPHISVGGAISTGTHGSGDRSQNLSAAVTGLDLVTADGELRRLRRGDGMLEGAVVGLGALGIIARVTLDIEPTYDVAQEVHLDLPWSAVLEDLDAVTGSADSVSLFTDWSGPTVRQWWRKTRLPRGEAYQPRGELFGARPALGPVHPLPGIDPVNCTEQLGVPGPWHERLPHFRLAFTPSNGDELQSEYLVPRTQAVAAIEAMRALAPSAAPLLQVAEIRTVAADDLWLSSAADSDRVGLHFTWQPRQPEVEAVLPLIESALYPLGARPHWGKLFHTVDAAASWPRWADFRALVGQVDPGQTFANAFLRRIGVYH